MNAIEKIISERNIPSVLTTKRGRVIKSARDFDSQRENIKHMLEEHIYGVMPPRPEHLKVELVTQDDRFAAGKAPLQKLNMTVTINGTDFTFPFYAVIPKNKTNIPAFIHINFRPDVPDRYMSSEELVDEGFAVFSFCYKDVTSDDNNFKNGIAKLLCPSRRALNSTGKIAMWAWAAMRIMDYIETLDVIDKSNVAVVGHSRLGKTALVTGAFDERFKYAMSNDSGCSGAAITRGKCGEHIVNITNNFSFWFCPRYAKYAADESTLPLDQNFLTALIAPRFIVIGSAEEDTWADPTSEFLNAYMTSDVYKLYGFVGLGKVDEIPQPKSVIEGDRICYQVRHGIHFFSREDWKVYTDYLKKNINN